MEAKTDTTDTEEVKRKLYYTIGGVRLKFNFNLDSLTVQEKNSTPKYSWTFSRAGRSCPSFVQKKDNSNCTVQAANAEIKDKTILWWEPNDWASPSSTDVTLKVTFSATSAADGSTVNLPEKKIRMRLQSRTLKAVADTEDPFNGSDVKMLEQMLWQLGVSPQGSYRGKSGSRIATAKLKKFQAGHVASSQSHELMVRRLQARSKGSGVTLSNTLTNVINHSDGIVGPNTINNLKTIWTDYLLAVQALPNRPTISTATGNDANIATWVENAANIWAEGFTTHNADGSENTTDVPVTYTLTEHNNVLTEAGVTAGADYTMAKFLEAWSLTESHTHWGPNYRMYLGSADEEGSIGFNQIVHKQRYSASPCTVQKRADLNYYHPEDNLKGFVVQTASRRTHVSVGCGGGFWFAYHSDGQGMRRVYGDGSLKGYRHVAGTGYGALHRMTTATNKNQQCQAASGNPVACEDAYDTLSKAIAFYNGETIVREWPGNSWPETLKNTVVTTTSSQQNGDAGNGQRYCFSCRYSILVREHFGLPKRQYIWQGGMYPPILMNADGTPQLDADGNSIPHPQAGQPWCFGYGESEWIGGTTWQSVHDSALDRNPDTGEVQTPVGRIDCTTGNPI